MKTTILTIMLVALIALTACDQSPTGNVIEEKTITVGFAGPLTGEAGAWGQNMKKGFEYGIAQIDNPRIQVVFEDTQCDAKIGLSAFQKLVQHDEATIITGTACSSVAHAVASLTEENNVLYIASGATQPDVPRLGEHIFRLWVSDDYEARAIAHEAHDLGMTRVAVSYNNDNPAGMSLRDAFVEETKNLGGTIVAQESYSTTEKDFRTAVTKMIAGDPQGIYIMATGEQLASVINQARELGYEGTIFAYAPSLVAQGVADKIKDHSKIVYAMPEEVKATAFWDEYEAQTGEEADMLVSLGYDSAMMIKEAIDACDTDTDCMSEYFIVRKDISTSRGTFEFDEHGSLGSVPFEILQLA